MKARTKIICIAAAVVTAWTVSASSIIQADIQSPSAGDVNRDNVLNSRDVTDFQSYFLNMTSFSNDQLKAADMNSDNNTNIADLVLMKNYVLYENEYQNQNQNQGTQGGNEPGSNVTMLADFRKGTSPEFFASDGWTNGDPFNCGWYESNATVANGKLTLKIDRDSTGKYSYSGGEYRTTDFYGYGYYETSMKAIKNDGVVSSFFTYTGESDKNPWDEIDIEILGKDTTQVQLNYYTNGTGKHEYMYNLGFDASEGYHKFGFDWQPDHITWYVDGKQVYTANSNIPSTPGRIMMNTWPGTGVDEWLKAYNGRTPLTAEYEWVTYTGSHKGKDSKEAAGNGGNQNQNQNPWDQNQNQNQNPWDQNQNQNQNPWDQNQNQNPWGQNNNNLAYNPAAEMIADLTKGTSSYFFPSGPWTNGGVFDCGFDPNNIKFGSEMEITITRDPSGQYHYLSGEYRSAINYHYGYYECSMKPIKGNGVDTGFFTYTGPSEGDPWDEIDFEFLGYDSRKVQLNYYTNGNGGHEYMLDLGFDASEDFHKYGFLWLQDSITWYVDGKERYRVNGGNLPSNPSKVMVNTWPGIDCDEWLKPFQGNVPLTAKYQWITWCSPETFRSKYNY